MQSITKSNRQRILYAVIVLFGILSDQISKSLAVKYLSTRDTLPLIRDVFHFTYVENRGAAFGMLKDHRWIFLVFSTIAIVALGIYLFRGVSYFSDKREDGTYPPLSTLGGVALSLIVSGGIGNMIDRLGFGFYVNESGMGEVVDFIDFCGIWNAIFNGADSFVCVGAGLLILALVLDIIKEYKSERSKKQ